MASLDVLDYQMALDAALAGPQADGRPLLAGPLRKQALRDARRIMEAMAFRFALMDERPLPEDLDYLRAIEALHKPERAALVFARRAPVYARVRRRRIATSLTVLAILGLAAGGLAYLATSEKSVELASFQESAAVNVTYGRNATFHVTPQMTRLYVEGQFFVGKASPGTIEVHLIDPAGRQARYWSFSYDTNPYLRENVEAPAPGNWTALVDFSDAIGSMSMTVNGVLPTR